MLNTKDNFVNVILNLIKGIFLGYYTTSKAPRIYYKTTLIVEETMHVVFDEFNVLLENREDY